MLREASMMRSGTSWPPLGCLRRHPILSQPRFERRERLRERKFQAATDKGAPTHPPRSVRTLTVIGRETEALRRSLVFIQQVSARVGTN